MSHVAYWCHVFTVFLGVNVNVSHLKAFIFQNKFLNFFILLFKMQVGTCSRKSLYMAYLYIYLCSEVLIRNYLTNFKLTFQY